MGKDEGGKTEIAATGVQVWDEPEVNLARRRALVQAGWAVPAILAVGLAPCKAKATYSGQPAGPVAGPFFTAEAAQEAIGGLAICHEEGHLCSTQPEPVLTTGFFVIDP
jgi:hypothetical protein